MGKKYLLDSNVIIGYLAGTLPQKGVVKRTIEICKQNKIKLPDAIIAATAFRR